MNGDWGVLFSLSKPTGYSQSAVSYIIFYYNSAGLTYFTGHRRILQLLQHTLCRAAHWQLTVCSAGSTSRPQQHCHWWWSSTNHMPAKCPRMDSRHRSRSAGCTRIHFASRARGRRWYRHWRLSVSGCYGSRKYLQSERSYRLCGRYVLMFLSDIYLKLNRE